MPKLTLEFNDRVNSMLEELAAKEGTTKVGIIRKALALFKYVDQEIGDDQDRGLAIVENNKVVHKIKVLH
jgi:predicted transcriptional regulator